MTPFWIGLLVGISLGTAGCFAALAFVSAGQPRRRARLPTTITELQHQLRMERARREALERQIWNRINDGLLRAQRERQARMS
jgi:hypothetical protein